MGSGVRLFEVLSEFIFRSSKDWSGKGKWISRRLKISDPVLEKEFFDSFEILFTKKNSQAVIEFAEKVLKPHGGFLFDGFKMQAKNDMRRALEK